MINKLIEIYRGYPDDERPTTGFGITFFLGLEGPFVYIKHEDRDYYSFLYINLHFWRNNYIIRIRLKKQPYKNLEQYKLWRKNEKKSN